MNRLNYEQISNTTEINKRGVSVSQLPKGIVLRERLGIVASEHLDGKIVHRARDPEGGLYECRATIAPNGDFLLMFPDGGHYGGKAEKVNDMLAYRSADRGATWQGPTIAFDIDYNQHGFIPLTPRGTNRIYAFGTQPVWDDERMNGLKQANGLHENAPIGFRHSDDNGHTWSGLTLIDPANDPGFRGMSVMRMCETDAGTWLLGSHEADWSYKPLMTRQYVLRSERPRTDVERCASQTSRRLVRSSVQSYGRGAAHQPRKRGRLSDDPHLRRSSLGTMERGRWSNLD